VNKVWTYTKTFTLGAIKGVQGLGTFVIGLFILLVVVSAIKGAGNKELPQVEEGAVLVLWPKGSVVELARLPEPFDNTIDLPGLPSPGAQESIHDLVRVLDAAIEDERLGALAIHTRNFAGAAPAHLHTLVKKINAFKATDRPVYAISASYGQSDYLLASQADTIFMNPAGELLITGYGSYPMYYKSLLDKLDASVNVFRVGTFKSAVEPYLRDDMSPAAKEANRAFLAALWSAYMDRVRQGRGLTEDQLDNEFSTLVEDLRAASGYLDIYAKNKGLVDAVVDTTEMRRQLIEKHGKSADGKSFKQITHRNYLASLQNPLAVKPANKIAVITAQGEIVPGSGPISVSASDTVVSYIRQARRDSKTKAIVLRVNSPGGSAYASEIIRQELVAAQDQGIPVIASMGPVAASGGYWISATADQIWAQPTTITGSIGIFGVLPTFEKTLAKIGVYSDGVGTTPLATGFNTSMPLSDRAKEVLQLNIEAGYDEFLKLVATGRDMSVEDVDKIAQGRVWIGTKAHELGLVDHLGDFQDAVKAASELADLEDYDLVFYRDKIDPFDQFLIDFLDKSSASDIPDLVDDYMPYNRPLIRAERSPLLDTVLGALPGTAIGFTANPDPRGRYVICEMCSLGNMP